MQREQAQIIDTAWIRQHLVLQEDCRRESMAAVLKDFLPPTIIRELTGQFIMVCRPTHSAATVIPAEILGNRPAIVLSVSLIPASYPPRNFPKEYIALIVLHELAHIYLNHSPPASDAMEDEAYEKALEWFNATQGLNWTMEDLAGLHREHDDFWLR